MTKLEMAHEYAKIIIEKILCGDIDNLQPHEIASDAFDWADAMQAEAEKREDTSRPDVLQDTWHEKALEDAKKYGVGFVRVSLKDGNFIYEQLDPKLVTLNYPNIQDEWQPDWSVAPKTAIEWFMIDNGRFKWKLLEDGEIWYAEAPSFGYQGSWENSLRKRP